VYCPRYIASTTRMCFLQGKGRLRSPLLPSTMPLISCFRKLPEKTVRFVFNADNLIWAQDSDDRHTVTLMLMNGPEVYIFGTLESLGLMKHKPILPPDGKPTASDLDAIAAEYLAAEQTSAEKTDAPAHPEKADS
jgi:hypothetical protein